MAQSDTKDQLWTVSDARLPDGIAGWNVLEIGCPKGQAEDYLRLGAAEALQSDEAPHPSDWPERAFELIRYSRARPTRAQPLAALTALWHLTSAEGVLLLDSPILADPSLSQYARFAPAPDDVAGPQWVPGRLALRWMVEVAGFDRVEWLGERPSGSGGSGVLSALIQAIRSERAPALELPRQLRAR